MHASTELYLDDVSVGDTFTTASKTVTEDEIFAFARSFDPQVFHLDPEAAKQTLFGALAASGWHTAAITMGLLVTSGLPFGGGLVGAGAELAWPTPTRPGDVLHADCIIEAIAPSMSKPDRGIVTVRTRTLAGDGAVRQNLVAQLLLFRRPPVEGS
jgi:acyl dehydratase